MNWRFKLYPSEKWNFLKQHNPGMAHAFCPDDNEFWKHEIGEREDLVSPAIAWCHEHFGKPFTGVWAHSSSWIMFGDDNRAFEFKLRWA
jgi:hypothetical protein